MRSDPGKYDRKEHHCDNVLTGLKRRGRVRTIQPRQGGETDAIKKNTDLKRNIFNTLLITQ